MTAPIDVAGAQPVTGAQPAEIASTPVTPPSFDREYGAGEWGCGEYGAVAPGAATSADEVGR